VDRQPRDLEDALEDLAHPRVVARRGGIVREHPDRHLNDEQFGPGAGTLRGENLIGSKGLAFQP
jgi:hypothetical protein